MPRSLHPPGRETPLLLAARRGHTGAVRLLLEHGAATDKPNSAGIVPLIAATLFGHDETVAALLARWEWRGWGPRCGVARGSGRLDCLAH